MFVSVFRSHENESGVLEELSRPPPRPDFNIGLCEMQQLTGKFILKRTFP